MTRKKVDPDSLMTVSSGNVFLDLGFPPVKLQYSRYGRTLWADFAY